MNCKSPEAFRTISEAAEEIGVAAHVLRFWESRFPFIQPLKRAGGRRLYRPSDIALLGEIRRLLHDEGWSIRRVQDLPRRRWRAAVVERRAPADQAAAIASGSLVRLRDALTRAVRAKVVLDGLLGSSTA